MTERAVRRVPGGRRLILGLSAVSALTLAGAFASDAGAETEASGVLRVAAPDEPTSLDPGLVQTNAAQNVFLNTHNTLLHYNLETYELEPELATSWEFSDDGLTLTFQIRDGVQFHNGQPLTSADVAWSIEQSAHPDNSATGDELATIESVAAPDASTVELHLSQPDYTIPAVLPEVNIRPDGWTFDPSDPDSVMGTGTGPFILAEWQPNQIIRLERNPDYWEAGLPKVDEIQLIRVPDTQTAVLRMQNGELDILPNPPFTQVEQLESSDNVEIVTPPPGRAGLYDLRINTKQAPWDDERVRQALAYALDRDAIGEALLGLYDPISNPIPPTSDFFAEDAIAYQLDVDKAKQLLADAGYPDGIDGGTLMTHFELGVDFEILSQLIQAQAATVGIQLEIENLDVPTFVDNLLAAEFDIGLSQTLGLQTPYDLLHHNVGRNRAAYGGFEESLADFLELIDSLRSLDPESAEFLAGVQEAQVQAALHVPVIIVGTRPQPVAIGSGVEGFTPHATGYLILEGVSVAS